MKKSDFYYELPQELIAQTPIEPRDASRLLSVERGSGRVTHRHFYEIHDLLSPGDLLVLNDSKVFPARLIAGDTELFLLEQKTADVWECIGRKLKKGKKIDFGGLTAEVLDVKQDGNRLVKFAYSGDFFEILDRIGQTPLPPYITEKLEDSARYNTVYAKYGGREGERLGSAAAPTAGLHFTERVFAALAEKGVETAYVTLHVGLGTFRPVKTDSVSEHKMHSERFWLPDSTAQKIRECKVRGGRVIAAGTTSCRVLESPPGLGGSTDIFIYPGYEFKVIDGLLTNFHLPESTLIMLVSAFLGREKTLAAYALAIRERYRFFSFGDAMLIL
jgi:S-adenosylmethionine:tRNA ribosyltransferase-isomerase